MKYYFTFLFAVLFTINGYGQCISTDPNSPACNDIISTDPGKPVNPERDANRFDWRTENLKVYYPDGGYGTNNTPQTSLANPFWTTVEYLEHINFHVDERDSGLSKDPKRLDFHPEDGWELLHRHTGFAPNEATLLSSSDHRYPYFILYNKYRNLIRVLISWNIPEIFDGAIANLSLEKPDANSNLQYSGLLNNHEGSARALDQPIAVREVAQVSKYVTGKRFVAWDFPKMTYDPCVCNNKSQIQISFQGYENASAILEGRSVGTIVDLSERNLANGRDFLANVYHDDFSVKGGMLTYKNIDRFKQEIREASRASDPVLNVIFSTFKSAVGAALGSGAHAVDQVIETKY